MVQSVYASLSGIARLPSCSRFDSGRSAHLRFFPRMTDSKLSHRSLSSTGVWYLMQKPINSNAVQVSHLPACSHSGWVVGAFRSLGGLFAGAVLDWGLTILNGVIRFKRQWGRKVAPITPDAGPLPGM